MPADRERRVWTRVIFACVVLGAGWFVLAFVLVATAASGSQRSDVEGDAIIILGAAQYNGEPSPVLEQRLETALELWSAGVAPIVVTTGANQPGDQFSEGFAGFRYLRNAGIGENQLLVVVDGGDTYESVLAAANQLDDDSRDVVLVTDAYHARRSADIASEVGLRATVVASSDDTSFGRLIRETVAVGVGRLISYRRLSALR